MSEQVTLEPPHSIPRDGAWLDRFARRQVHAAAAWIREGQLCIREGNAEHVYGDDSAPDELRARVDVRSSRAYRKLLFGGTIGAAEAYMEGMWDCDALCNLARLFYRNRLALERLDSGWARVGKSVNRGYHRVRPNTRRGSRRNIAAHYDLGNDFFELFLDPTLTYSCGVFEHPQATMEEASVAKIERLCEKLRLTPDDHLLEIGTGWGGFAVHAASTYGCRVTTATISREQHAVATAHVREAGLTDRVNVLLRDYRDLDGRYSKLVSVEMIEAVGHRYFDTFFSKCSQLLSADGMMAIQAITIRDQLYNDYVGDVDFIKRYIFPGGCLPSLTRMADAMTNATDFRLLHLEDFAPHYAHTLELWRNRFDENRGRIQSLGYPEVFLRMWEFYLGFCEGGFAENNTGLVQLPFAKPGMRCEGLRP